MKHVLPGKKKKEETDCNLRYLGFYRAFDERPKARNRDDKETKGSVVASQGIARTLCYQKYRIWILLEVVYNSRRGHNGVL